MFKAIFVFAIGFVCGVAYSGCRDCSHIGVVGQTVPNGTR